MPVGGSRRPVPLRETGRPGMKSRRAGAIINIASTAGIMGMPYRAPYVAAKFGVIGLTKALAMELGRHNIRVNAVAPGAITGDRMERVVEAHAEAEGLSRSEVRASYASGTSMGTFVSPEEVAAVVVYLASRCASISVARPSRWMATPRPCTRDRVEQVDGRGRHRTDRRHEAGQGPPIRCPRAGRVSFPNSPGRSAPLPLDHRFAPSGG